MTLEEALDVAWYLTEENEEQNIRAMLNQEQDYVVSAFRVLAAALVRRDASVEKYRSRWRRADGRLGPR